MLIFRVIPVILILVKVSKTLMGQHDLLWILPRSIIKDSVGLNRHTWSRIVLNFGLGILNTVVVFVGISKTRSLRNNVAVTHTLIQS